MADTVDIQPMEDKTRKSFPNEKSAGKHLTTNVYVRLPAYLSYILRNIHSPAAKE